jgi:hypothetical protein
VFYPRPVRRGNPERIREAQRAGFIARLASARNIDRERAEQEVNALEAELDVLGVERDSFRWHQELERRAGLGPN